MSWLLKIGMGLILLGVVFIFLSSIQLAGKEKESKTKIAVGGLIGPIPFGFGNDKDWVRFVVFIVVVIFVIWVLAGTVWLK